MFGTRELRHVRTNFGDDSDCAITFDTRNGTEELDSIIAAHSKQRSLNRVPAVNRSILRLALYELKNMPQTPVNVVISEAVHLSQAYAYPEDTAFINGVLGAYARSKPAAKEDTADGTNSGD